MTPTEIAFLALGLVLGTAVGAAIVQAMARRPAPRREVRVTVTPNAIPSRRSSTLAVPKGFIIHGPLPGSPDARALHDDDDHPGGTGGTAAPGGTSGTAPAGPGTPGTRTRVPSGPFGIPVAAVGIPVVVAAADAGPARAAGASPAPVRVPARDVDPIPPPTAPEARGQVVESAAAAVGVALLEAVVDMTVVEVLPPPAPARDDTFTTLVRPRPPAPPIRPFLPATAVAVRVHVPEPPILRPRAGTGPSGSGAQGPGSGTAQPGTSTDPCAGPRRLVEERCALSDAAREQARSAADALREAQRVYDVLRERVDRAQVTADPRNVAADKERLHAEFRLASDRSAGPDDTEAAARVWLSRINELNNAVREAQRILDAGNAELRAQVPILDRLAAEADAARIAGENAEAGCRDAREDLASCEEADARARAAVPPPAEDPHPFEHAWPSEPDGPDADHPSSPAELLSGVPVIVRILRGDREARQRLVATLAAGEPDGEREWGLRVSRLVDAIHARAIEDGYLDLPEDDSFWRLFERREARDIVGALSALGYRFDGMGGFADGRVPPARDLSMAVGYAGLDRMRIRTWPRDAEISELYERAVVAADEWLSDQAGDLSLGRMVDALGNRAAELADLWNAWGRVRPALLSG